MLTCSTSDIQVGQILVFDYPRLNVVNRTPQYRRRTIVVRSVRFIEAEPLSPQTIDLMPLRRRGRTLITGYDLDLQAERSFYLESMRHARRDTWLGLALYDPLDDARPVVWDDWVFAPTELDMAFLADVCRRFREIAEQDPDVTLNVAVLPIPENHA